MAQQRCQREGHSSAAGPGGRCVLGVWKVAGSASVWLQQKKQIERSAADSLCDADWPSPLQPANSPIWVQKAVQGLCRADGASICAVRYLWRPDHTGVYRAFLPRYKYLIIIEGVQQSVAPRFSVRAGGLWPEYRTITRDWYGKAYNSAVLKRQHKILFG